MNFNNMIPVTSKNYIEFDLSKTPKEDSERKRYKLLNNQLRWLTTNKKEIHQKSKLLYDLYKEEKLPQNVKSRCCNFILLESKCNEYNKTTKIA